MQFTASSGAVGAVGEQKTVPPTPPVPHRSPSLKKTVPGVASLRAAHPFGSEPLNVMAQPTTFGAVVGQLNVRQSLLVVIGAATRPHSHGPHVGLALG